MRTSEIFNCENIAVKKHFEEKDSPALGYLTVPGAVERLKNVYQQIEMIQFMAENVPREKLEESKPDFFENYPALLRSLPHAGGLQ